MHNVANKFIKKIVLTACFLSSGAFTQIDQDVGVWRVGDKVNIYNPAGYGAIYGRAHAFGNVFYRYGPTPDSIDNNSSNGGSGAGNGGESGNGGGSGGTIIIIGGGGSDSSTPCPGGVTVSPDGSVVTCHQT